MQVRLSKCVSYCVIRCMDASYGAMLHSVFTYNKVYIIVSE